MVDVSPMRVLRERAGRGEVTMPQAQKEIQDFFAPLSVEDTKVAVAELGMHRKPSSKTQAVKFITDRILDAVHQAQRAARVQMSYFRVKSAKGFFGRYKSLEEAQVAADNANAEQKSGSDEWEPEEKASGDVYSPGDSVMYNGSVFRIERVTGPQIKISKIVTAREIGY